MLPDLQLECEGGFMPEQNEIILCNFLHCRHAEGETATAIMTGKLVVVMFVRYYLVCRPLIESGEYSKLMVSKSYYFPLCCT